MEKLVSTGIRIIDDLLKGGLIRGTITTIYGESATGKTNICMISALHNAKTKKIIYIDSEGNASKTRLLQLASSRKILDNILFLKPTTFQEQIEIFNKLKDMLNDTIGMVIADSISMLYRVELSNKELFKANQELGKQLSYLLEIARKRHIPCIATAQVYNDFDAKNLKIVGGEIIKYASKVIIKLGNEKNYHYALLEKHPFLPKRKVKFIITQKGLMRPTLF